MIDELPTPRDLAWHEAGRGEGITEGRRQAEAEYAAVWAAAAEVARRTAARMGQVSRIPGVAE